MLYRSYDEYRKQGGWETGLDILGLSGNPTLNVSHLVVDRNAETSASKTALIALDHAGGRQEITFSGLTDGVCRFAGALRAIGVRRGDRIATLIPPQAELYFAVLGALRVGAIVCPLFPALGVQAVADRLKDSGARVVVTCARELAKVRRATQGTREPVRVLVAGEAPLEEGELAVHDLMAGAAADDSPEQMAPDDPLLIHYTSGTTGRPKGVVHVHGAIVGHAATARAVLDLREGDIYWCTADPGWVTGTSYGIFGPWANGVTQIAYASGYSPAAWYRLIESERVTVWYTSPTALRMLRRDGLDLAASYDLSSLRHICSVGEPLNPEVIEWGVQAYGLTIHDTWWQTETGCIQIANYAFMEVRPGSMGRPVADAEAAVLDPATLAVLPPGSCGLLALRRPWPSMFRGYWADEEAYRGRFHGPWYLTGDLASVDADGYYWYVGRGDETINTSGHLVGPFEVESALLRNPAVVEAAAFSTPCPDLGEAVTAWVVLRPGFQLDRELTRTLRTAVRRDVAPFAVPREIIAVEGLPRTRSGKILRRVARAQHLGLPTGDTSSLETE